MLTIIVKIKLLNFTVWWQLIKLIRSDVISIRNSDYFKLYKMCEMLNIGTHR